MEIKTPTRFEPFKDGVCWICAVQDGKAVRRFVRKYDDRVVGYKRYLISVQADTQITRIIRIPRTETEDGDIVLIGGDSYRIIQNQQFPNTNPPCTDLTLERLKRRYEVI